MATGLLNPGRRITVSRRYFLRRVLVGGLSAGAVIGLAPLRSVSGVGTAARAAVPPPPQQRPAQPPRRPEGSPPGAADVFGDGPVKVFEPRTWGYRLTFPGQWIARTPRPYTLVLSGPEGSDAFYATVTLQNRRVDDGIPPEQAAEQVLSAYREDLQSRYESLQVLRDTIFRPPPNTVDGQRSDLPHGRQLVVAWKTPNGVPMYQWAVCRPRPHGSVAHLWAFTGDSALFDTYLPIARAILDTWSIVTE